MARKLSVTAPNGKTYDVEAPDNATDDEIHAEVLRMHPEAGGDSPLIVDVGGDARVPRKGEQGYDDYLKAGYTELPNGDLSTIDSDGKPLVVTPGLRPSQRGAVPGNAQYDQAIASGDRNDGMGGLVSADQPDTRPTSFGQGFIEGAEKPWNNAADWLTKGLNYIPVNGGALSALGQSKGLGDALNEFGASIGIGQPTVAADRQYQDQQNRASDYQGSGLGNFTGNVVGSAALSVLPGGALAKGAQAGALLTDNPDDPLAVARDAGIGAVAGKVGEKVLGAAASVAAPVVNPAIRTLMDAGVRLTPGQFGRGSGTAFGKFVGRMEDKASTRPWVGDAISDARDAAGDDFGRAAVNRAVAPIGLKLPEGLPMGRSAVKWAGDKLSSEYDQIAPQIRVGSDPQWVSDLAAISDETSTMLPERATQFNNILKGLGRFFDSNGQVLSGQAFKRVDTRLAESIGRYSRSTDADQQQLGTMLASIREAMYDAAARQNPGVADRIVSLNTGWKSLTQAERAIANSKGTISPNGYSSAVKMSSDTVRRRGYARGNALNQDLADAGSSILPSTLGDSGTAARTGGLQANLMGLLQTPGFNAAKGGVNLLTRQKNISPELARLLLIASNAAPAVGGAIAPPAVGKTLGY